MKKTTLTKLAMILLSVLGLMAASTTNSVQIFDTATQETMYCSYFTLVEDLYLGFCMPFAALLCGVTLMLVVLWAFGKKDGLLKPIAGTSFLSMTLAVVPILVKGDGSILVVPHVAVPIAMGITCLVAYTASHKPQSEEPQGQRLG